jgi:N-acetylglucosaminyldiphosphoundecaprenol N-acetyl-beta-D-mannosaminyltransferase
MHDGEVRGPGDVVLDGTPVDPVTSQQAVRRVVDASARGEGGLLVTANLDHLRQLSNGSWLGAVYADADLVVADGMPLVWASRLQGTPLPERVAGSELLWSLCAAAAEASVAVYLCGGRPGACEETAARLRELCPQIEVAGVECPPLGFEREHGALDAMAARIEASGAGIVFTALGSPKQELLNAALRQRLPDRWFVGVGAAFDMAGGVVPQAPVWMRRTGLEWAFRLAREPRRLFRRYVVHDAPFAVRLLAGSARAGRRHQGVRTDDTPPGDARPGRPRERQRAGRRWGASAGERGRSPQPTQGVRRSRRAS